MNRVAWPSPLISGAHAYNNNTRPDTVRVYGARYSATRQLFSTTALHLLHVRRGFCTLVILITIIIDVKNKKLLLHSYNCHC